MIRLSCRVKTCAFPLASGCISTNAVRYFVTASTLSLYHLGKTSSIERSYQDRFDRQAVIDYAPTWKTGECDVECCDTTY